MNPRCRPSQSRQPLTDEETALDLLAEVFDAYENGTPCYEEPDEHGGFVGNAFILSDETFHACADLLNRRRPVAAAPQKPKD